MKKHRWVLSLLLFWSVGLSFCHKTREQPILVDPCGNTFDPSNLLGTLTGTYKGQKTYNGTYNEVTFQVCLISGATDQLLINTDPVPIDTACLCSPNPSILGYRWYHAWFRNDSLFVYTDTGWLNHPNETSYALKKQ